MRCKSDVILIGDVVGKPEFYYETKDEQFYKFMIKVKRLSDAYDELPVVVPSSMVGEGNPIEEGAHLKVLGTYKSYNLINGEKRKLLLNVYAYSIEETQDDYKNGISMTGYLCKVADLRETPLGRVIIDCTMAVNRSGGRSDYIPTIAWGGLANSIEKIGVGASVTVEGRIQSRKYHKSLGNGKVEERTAYEVSINNVTVLKAEVGDSLEE
jgi:primosomal replication protein N